MIFVFGSNELGKHGRGAAKYAMEHYGAIYGCGQGLMGNSYAIPTKDIYIITLPLDVIQQYVDVFKSFATRYIKTRDFKVTRIGCGLAGYKDADIAPMFRNFPNNCWFDAQWHNWLGTALYWGDYIDGTKATETGNSSS